MLHFGIIIYILITIGIGFWASSKVKTSDDFLLAGRSLPLALSTTALFATWFGAESVLGASSEMAQKGLIGVIEDPFGAALCLLLLAVVFARPLYRLQLRTFGDFFGVKYDKNLEIIASLILIISYFGWIAGQFVALGILFKSIFLVDLETGILIGTAIVTLYTFWGGLWSVAILDFIQNIVIIIGLLGVLIQILPGLDWNSLNTKLPPDYFDFFPKSNATDWLNWFAAWITLSLGSIPGQDIFQRVNASKTENIAVKSAYLGTFLYLFVGMIPLVVAVYVRIHHPEYLQNEDPQTILPNFILNHTNPLLQLFFFGALLSAIMSTASGVLVAGAAILTENFIIKVIKNASDSKMLRISRISVLALSAISLIMSLSNSNVYELVSMASSIGLVGLFVPMFGGLFLKKPSLWAAYLSMILGFVVWVICEIQVTEINPIMFGLAASILAWFLGDILEKLFKKR